MTDKNNTFAVRGHICFSPDSERLLTVENGWVICENNICQGVYERLPEQYKNIELMEFEDCIITPGLIDLHVHAPQYAFRGIGMDMELIDWLNHYTFAEEAKYSSLEYAKSAYDIFVEDLCKSGTTRACIFGTIHRESVNLLMDLLEETGIIACVGKVNMDRNCPENVCEPSVSASLAETTIWIEESLQKYRRVSPILTPRFIPTCSDELMEELASIQRKYGLPVQSHLSENLGEAEWVKELCPDVTTYGGAYDKYGLFGKECRTIMAHCVQSQDEEIELLRKRGVYVAHCPQSNSNLSSGVAPIQKYLELGVRTGLGSDIAGGAVLSIFRAITDAIQCSKLRWRLLESDCRPLTFQQAFYMATKGGGEFFGKVGSFEKGYEFDALVLDDRGLKHPQPLNAAERLERFAYLGDDRAIKAKFVKGMRII